MRTADFDYDLPSDLIAQTPLEPRDASRLMVLDRKSQSLVHAQFCRLADFLHAGDLLVCNDSRVIRARLLGRKIPTAGKVEVLLTVQRSGKVWEALLRGRRVKVGGQVEFVGDVGRGSTPTLRGRIMGAVSGGARLVRFEEPVEPLLAELGSVPLPPYIHETLEDEERYQTVYATHDGSVAAPTAGLHFTAELMDALERKGMEFAFLTLHVSIDTFRPVREERLEDHEMLSEYCRVPNATAQAINQARSEGRRVVAVGTTVVRALETAAGGLSAGDGDVVEPHEGQTDLFIRPGHRFRVVDALITNFHLPRSTLLMLVAAFTGKELLHAAYDEAIEQRYRFYSFGDAMLVL